MKRVWLAVIALVLVLMIAGAAWWVRGLKSGEAPKRQVAKISILPDTPPPPPPPPKEEKKPEPPKDESRQIREEQIKQVEAPKPANEPIKMEGAAGDGPSAFGAGSVNREYSGGAPATGAAGGNGTTSDRAQERFFANTARQLLRDAIERNLKSDATQATAEFSVWIARDGGISRFELRTTGDARLDGELNAALDETARALKLPPPPPPLAAAQPMKFRLHVRPLG